MNSEINLALFGEDNVNFLANTMWLDLMYIQKEISKTSLSNSMFFKELFTWMVENHISYSKDYTIATNNFTTQKKLYEAYGEIAKKYKVDTEYYIAKELCHVYGSFCMGGIEDTWLYADYSAWYPRMIWKESVASDVEMLDEKTTIYRGTSQDEFNSKKFGQSWTIKKGRASKFAFTEYRNSSRHENQVKVVLKALVSRDGVLYYKKNTTAKEYEVIINPDKLVDVFVIDTRY